jgi:hypothetical protein
MTRRRAGAVPWTAIARLLPAAALGVGAALLVACGSSAGKLIPAAAAGPLQNDFEAVAQAAQSGNGNCAATEAALLKTEQDFASLPSTVDGGLRNTLRQGIANLRVHALELCKQPLVATTSTPTKTTSTPTTPTSTNTTPTTTTPTTTQTTPTTPTTSGPGGGTPAPEHETPPQGGGTGVGESGGGAAPGAGQEGGK